MTHVLDDLAWRGLLAQTTDLDALRAAFDSGPVTYYCGFDPTAPSLHHGHLVQLLTMRRLQRAGNKPLALVGGSTGLIGDPRPSSERQLQTKETVAGWVERIAAQIEPYLDFSGSYAAQLVNNLSWTQPMSAIDFLRDVGKHFSVNRMLAKDAVSARLESETGISYTEFSYQLLQALDFLELNRRHGCTLQTAGSDQWGNMTAGLDLLRRSDGVTAHALGTPLLTKADGTKFGKSEGGAIWLDPELTSPYAFYQFWFHAEDAQVGHYLRVLSDQPAEEIERLEQQVVERPAAREAQRTLAREMTRFVHGDTECSLAEQAAATLFGFGGFGSLPESTLESVVREVPSIDESANSVRTWAELFEAVGLVESRSAARRVAAEGGLYANNVRVSDALVAPRQDEWFYGRFLILRRGRQKVGAVRRVSA